MDLCGFKASLVYMVTSRAAWQMKTLNIKLCFLYTSIHVCAHTNTYMQHTHLLWLQSIELPLQT